METERIEHRAEEETQLPLNVNDVITELLDTEQEGSRLVSAEGRTYIIVALGQRPTGGYDVDVSHIEKESETLNIYAVEIEPAKDAIVTQALTYPYTVVSIPGDLSSYRVNVQLSKQ